MRSSLPRRAGARRAPRAVLEAARDTRLEPPDRASTTLGAWTRALLCAEVPPRERVAFARRHGFPLDAGPDDRISSDCCVAVWAALTNAHPDPLRGVHLAQALEPAHLGIVGYLGVLSRTLDEALTRTVDFHRLLKDPGQNALVRARAHVTLIDEPAAGHPPWPRHLAEATLAAYVSLGSRWTGRRLVPRRVTFQHAAPACADALREAFGAPIEFGHTLNSLELPAAALAWPLKTHDEALLRYVSEEATRRLEPLRRTEGALVDALKRWVEARLPEPPVTLAAAARHLGRSPRALQRALAERGRTFEQLVDEVRCAVSARLATDGSLGRSERAFLVGFSDLSGLRRAERRWRSATPSTPS
ncbi:MAG: AraC family transcriptional regulator ligand-binding domain-containing protein [Myxococcaceae bacterium]|nr:AraC family transcriptional regulator ligand-binding domain-containing protein [Myxococcaceae bacterium]